MLIGMQLVLASTAHSKIFSALLKYIDRIGLIPARPDFLALALTINGMLTRIGT